MSKVILIDNGHGQGSGNQSPDGSLHEWIYCREIAALVVAGCRKHGIDAHLLTPEAYDISLNVRVRRANAWCSKVGSSNVALVSIHNNAAGAGKTWRSARGFLPYIDPKASAASKRLAILLYDEAIKRGLKGNRAQSPYVTKLLTITNKTLCPAVLTENLFQDNKQDVAFLLSDEGKKKIVETHIEAVARYVFFD